MIKRRFAFGDSCGPNVNNLQRNFWHLALEGYKELLRKWGTYTIREEDEWESEEYTEHDFVVDAAVVLILAGTSITQLIGQNIEPNSERVPPPRKAYEQLLGHPPSADLISFIDLYDSLRHFGFPKHDAVESITPELLCHHLSTAQSVWQDVLRHRDEPIGEHLQNNFVFPE